MSALIFVSCSASVISPSSNGSNSGNGTEDGGNTGGGTGGDGGSGGDGGNKAVAVLKYQIYLGLI